VGSTLFAGQGRQVLQVPLSLVSGFRFGGGSSGFGACDFNTFLQGLGFGMRQVPNGRKFGHSAIRLGFGLLDGGSVGLRVWAFGHSVIVQGVGLRISGVEMRITGFSRQ